MCLCALCELCCTCVECAACLAGCTLCLDSRSMILRADGTLTPLSHVQIGDMIMTLDKKTGEPVSTQVIMFAHIEPHAESKSHLILLASLFYISVCLAMFYKIVTESGKSLLLSANHLVAVPGGKFKLARDLKTDQDQVVVFDSTQRVEEKLVDVSVEECNSFLAPITYTGTFLANGVLVSCYAEVESHRLAHDAMKPVRWWSSLQATLQKLMGNNRLTNKMQTKRQDEGIHWYPTALYVMAKPFYDFAPTNDITTS